jgi:hypothetical protein
MLQVQTDMILYHPTVLNTRVRVNITNVGEEEGIYLALNLKALKTIL